MPADRVPVERRLRVVVGALQVWLTNVTAFGLAYWELDRGGPVGRTQLPRDDLPLADFSFSQDENHDGGQRVALNSSALRIVRFGTG
ncbi:MAG TPA: hypothetical protein VFX16_36580 [Pseudonocardiaceae bacterium]|nr:hypothetical protein [Pseudonocardiaceae bacterium]